MIEIYNKFPNQKIEIVIKLFQALYEAFIVRFRDMVKILGLSF